MLNGTVRQALLHSSQQLKLLIVFIRTAVAIIFMRLPQPNTIRFETEVPPLKDANVPNLESRVINSNLADSDQVSINLLGDDSLNVFAAMSKVDKPVYFNDDAVTRLKNLCEQGEGSSLRAGPVIDARTA